MCEHRWGEIDHTKTTSQTLQKCKNSIRNVDKRGDKRVYKDEKIAEDRELCAQNFMAHLEAAKSGDQRHKIRGKRVGINNFVKDALQLLQDLEQRTQFDDAFSESMHCRMKRCRMYFKDVSIQLRLKETLLGVERQCQTEYKC